MAKLVIVESPSKAKTIQKYLGNEYEVMASMGHVRDLPKARLSVDVKDHFKPKYSIIKGKEKLVKELKEAAANADGVLLATDPDREGEAISWHLAYILGLDEDAPDRVTFNEITRTGVEEGMAHPRAIDLDLVNAQQARRILDRLVGYTLSPFLAKTIRRGLSAGRVQSVAVRMVVDREEEIKAFVPQEYWSIDAKLTAPPSKAVFAAAFYGDENGEIKIGSKEESDKLFEELEKEDFLVTAVKKGKKNRSPAPPFITSTLQQEASRKLGFQARRTMKAAQELYEGVEVEGMGSIGFKASGFNVAFEGFTALYEESKDEEEKAGKDLPPLEVGMKLKVRDLKGNQHFTQPPPRYTEASLIKALEENGIGRPSTYAATIATITTREYVTRECKAFKPTELGEVITQLMKERFPKIVNVKFTAQVENELDAVQRGDEDWVDTLQKFYDDFDKTVQKAKKEMDGVKIQLKEDETDVICEKCGRKMVVKFGRYGKFLACPGYPECKNVKKIVNDTGAECPKCGGKIIQRKSKKGRVFYGCSEYPKCDFVSWDPPSKEKCPVCGKTLLQKKSKDKMLYCVTPGCTFPGKKPAQEDEA